AHRACDALGRPEQITEHGDRRAVRTAPIACRLLEQQRRSALFQHAVAERRHLEIRIDGDTNALQLADRLELREEISQIAIAHRARTRSRAMQREYSAPRRLKH